MLMSCLRRGSIHGNRFFLPPIIFFGTNWTAHSYTMLFRISQAVMPSSCWSTGKSLVASALFRPSQSTLSKLYTSLDALIGRTDETESITRSRASWSLTLGTTSDVETKVGTSARKWSSVFSVVSVVLVGT